MIAFVTQSETDSDFKGARKSKSRPTIVTAVADRTKAHKLSSAVSMQSNAGPGGYHSYETLPQRRGGSQQPTMQLMKGELPGTVFVASVPSSTSSHSTGGVIDTSLPEFSRIGWPSVFLPRIYRALFCSLEPFRDFGKGQHSLLNTLDAALEAAYPGHTWTLKHGDKIYEKVRISLQLPSKLF